jgi:beta-glucosidase
MSMFPPDFFWGAATSSYQVEGGITNNWSSWEQEDLSRPQSGKAADHYHRFEEDFSLAKELNHTAHRFSIEWSRIEPEQGRYDATEIAHYKAVVASLRAKGIEPIITLWHWTFPTWLGERGGWLAPNALDYFEGFIKTIAAAIPDITYWAVLNEPEVYATNAYLSGNRPPARKEPISYLRVLHKLIQAHRVAYTAIKAISPKAQVGIAKDCYAFTLAQPTLKNRCIRLAAHVWRNILFIHYLKSTLDWIGLNYYVRFMIDGREPLRMGGAIRDLGPDGAPAGLLPLLTWANRYKKPIMITENGVNDGEDHFRGPYIERIISELAKARQADIPLIGYLHWSLLDNLEWESGFSQQFGLIAVDYTAESLTRKVRQSARRYAELIAQS